MDSNKAKEVIKKSPLADVWQYVIWAGFAIEQLVIGFASIEPLFGSYSAVVFGVLSVLRIGFKVAQHIRQSKADNAG